MPAELRHQRITQFQAVLILVIALGLSLSYPLFLLKGPEEQLAAAIKTQALQLERQIRDMGPLQNEATKLRQDIAEAKKADDEARKSYQSLIGNLRIPWSVLIGDATSRLPPGITVNSMVVNNMTLEIHGVAQTFDGLITYQEQLMTLKGVQQVSINTLANDQFILLVQAKPGGLP
ncbi:MAG: hypothetical protein HY687_01045 [Chloroflexi bacterium]|nr:hypothetical protein [Chloroflexota bacterium]